MGAIDTRLKELDIVLPEPPLPVASYVPAVRAGNLIHISGQVSLDGSGLITGKVGADLDIPAAQAAARICGLNIIAQAKAALNGDLDQLARIVRLGGFVNAAPGFVDIPQVINGCSDLMVEVFADKGKHARSAVGCAELPMNVAVEVDAIIEAV